MPELSISYCGEIHFSILLMAVAISDYFMLYTCLMVPVNYKLSRVAFHVVAVAIILANGRIFFADAPRRDSE
jgi:hypothetical protein